MINEKLLEILVINQIYKDLKFNSEKCKWTFRGNIIDTNELDDRYIKLVDEFLEPYVIGNISKEN